MYTFARRCYVNTSDLDRDGTDRRVGSDIEANVAAYRLELQEAHVKKLSSEQSVLEVHIRTQSCERAVEKLSTCTAGIVHEHNQLPNN